MIKTTTILPHGTADLFLTDGGLETSLIFLDGVELPYFAAFHLLKDSEGRNRLKNYYRRYLRIAKDFQTHFILDSPTWRANPDWIEKLHYPKEAVYEINESAIGLIKELQKEYEGAISNIIINGCIGPRGDGYHPGTIMTADEAQTYHAQQIEAFSRAGVNMVSAITMNYVEEAIGITRAAAAAGLPVVISFTVETDGQLPTGMPLQQAIEQVDASAAIKPVYYMINCAHPTHFLQPLQAGKQSGWVQRIRGIRANASCKSHAELDEATELDRGDLTALASMNQQLKRELKHLNVFGGCCGTDEAHILEITRRLTEVDEPTKR